MSKKSVYVFRKNGDFMVKIGVSANPESRVKKLNVKNYNGYSLFFTSPVHMSCKIEKRIHDMLWKYDVGKEFFMYPANKARWIVKNMVRNYENIPRKKGKKEKSLAREIRFLGMSQKELSRKLGVHENTVSNWVNGSVVISPQFFVKLKELGIPVKVLKNPTGVTA